MWYHKKFFKYATATLLLLSILLLILQLSPILNTIIQFVTTLLFPLIFSGLLFYIFRPLRNFLERKIPRVFAIWIIYLMAMLGLFLISLYLWPSFSKQISEFTESPENKIEEVQSKTLNLIRSFKITDFTIDELRQWFNIFLKTISDWLTQDVLSLAAKVTQIASLIIFTPFILFYLLNDSGWLMQNFLHFIPKEYKHLVRRVLNDIDDTLSIYIGGQLLVGIVIGALVYIGYTIIGLQYAFLLALLALIFNMIPFIGTFISTIPAVLIGFADSPFMSLKVLLVVSLVHLLDANVISPYILGTRLNIHPLMIILLLLACGSLYGILGLLLATPLYAILKVLLIDLYWEKNNGDD